MEQARQTTPRPAADRPPSSPTEVTGGHIIDEHTQAGYRFELFAIDGGGHLIVINGQPVERISGTDQVAFASFGRRIGATESDPLPLPELEAVN